MALERQRFTETPLYSCSKTKGLPGLPPLPSSSDRDPSHLYQVVLRHSEHPPIMKSTSWTKAAPYKEQKHHRSPSESIANNYTPTASDLKLKDIPKHRVALKVNKDAFNPPKPLPAVRLSPRNKTRAQRAEQAN
uniref:Uncharacterized protein n=2 Tax=Capitella teleta TaxID=283909 RepID=X1ZK09_CAPTE